MKFTRKAMKPCGWKPCERSPVGCSHYCAEHREEARRNIIRSLGFAAPTSNMWRDGDEEWLLARDGAA